MERFGVQIPGNELGVGPLNKFVGFVPDGPVLQLSLEGFDFRIEVKGTPMNVLEYVPVFERDIAFKEICS
jgi:hypothetical protein